MNLSMELFFSEEKLLVEANHAEKAEKVLAEQGERLAVALHDAKMPVQLILLDAQLLEEEAKQLPGAHSASIQEYVDLLKDHCGQLRRATSEVAKLARHCYESAACKMDRIIRSLCHSVRPYATSLGVALDYVTASGDSPVADPVGFERALSNLIHNALHPQHGARHVRVSLSVGSEAALIFVDDDGNGVDDALLPVLFEPFYSGDGGTGMGLYGVRRYARSHGGEATYERSPMGGARFVLRLPSHWADSDNAIR